MEKNKEKEVDVLLEEADKCFVIMPISDQGEYPKGHFSKVYEQIFKPAILEAGYEPYSDHPHLTFHLSQSLLKASFLEPYLSLTSK